MAKDREIGPLSTTGAKAWVREPSYDPTENAFDLVVRRPDGTTVAIGVSYDVLAQMGIHSEQQDAWLLELANAEAQLSYPPPPVPQK